MANSRICSIDGCDKTHSALSLCKSHYSRWKKHGDPLGGRTFRGEPERFYRETVLTYGGDTCLIWPFSRSVGYGKINRDGKPAWVHRLVCQEIHGPPPTPKHQAAHSCGKGHEGCVTPAHISWKSQKENESDKLIHGTHNRGERHGLAKLTEEQVIEIRNLKGKFLQKRIAEQYGISQTTVSSIHLGKHWGGLAHQKGD